MAGRNSYQVFVERYLEVDEGYGDPDTKRLVLDDTFDADDLPSLFRELSEDPRVSYAHSEDEAYRQGRIEDRKAAK